MCSSSAAVWPVCIPRSPPRRAALRCVFSAKARPARRNSVVAMSVHRFAPGRARPARGLPPPLPCFRRGTAGRGDRGVLCRSRSRCHGAARSLGLPLEYRTLSENGGEYPYLACCSPKQGRILTKAVREKLNEYPNITVEDGVTVAIFLPKTTAHRASLRSAARKCAYTQPKR